MSENRDLVAPDPDGHNRALDRVAAEHLRSVAPGLAASQHVDAERAPRDWPEDRAHDNGNYECLCSSCGLMFIGHAREQRDAAQELLSEALCNLGTARGDRAESLSTLRAATVKVITEALDGAPVISAVTDPDTQSAREKAARLYARAEEAERRALMAGQDKVAAQRRADSSHRLMENERAARVKAEAERDEEKSGRIAVAAAFRRVRERLGVETNEDEQPLDTAESAAIGAVDGLIDNRDLFHRRLAAAEAEAARLNGVVDEHAADAMRAGLERAKTERRLREATEEIVRVRLAYDDPSLDGTDGAHPAWWRGCDHGVRHAAKAAEAALDDPLPFSGGVGDEVLDRVRQRIAVLRAAREVRP